MFGAARRRAAGARRRGRAAGRPGSLFLWPCRPGPPLARPREGPSKRVIAGREADPRGEGTHPTPAPARAPQPAAARPPPAAVLRATRTRWPGNPHWRCCLRGRTGDGSRGLAPSRAGLASRGTVWPRPLLYAQPRHLHSISVGGREPYYPRSAAGGTLPPARDFIRRPPASGRAGGPGEHRATAWRMPAVSPPLARLAPCRPRTQQHLPLQRSRCVQVQGGHHCQRASAVAPLFQQQPLAHARHLHTPTGGAAQCQQAAWSCRCADGRTPAE